MKMLILLSLMLGFSGQSTHASLPRVNPVPRLERVVWIWLENTPDAAMINQRYIRGLWFNYPSVHLSNMNSIGSVTQANAVAMISGSDYGIRDNELIRMFTPTIVNLMEAKGVTWRVYAEEYPGACYLNEGIGDYKRYRVPFLSFSQIQTDRYLCSKVVSFKFLQDDIDYGSLPQVSIVIPSLKGSGATTGISSAENTLRNIVDPILSNAELLSHTTIMITTTNNKSTRNPELFSMILGNGVADYAMEIDEEYNHYNLLRTIEDGFGLGTLGLNDAKASPMVGFWK